MAALLASVSHADIGLLFVLLAIIAFAVAVYLCYIGNFIAGLVAALIGVIILVFAA